MVDALAPAAGEYVIRKTQPSAFFGTGLVGWLAQKRVDTVLVTGCTTSGCVRASVIDAMSHNFRTVVVSDCVGDRAIAPHEANLFDMEQKYADLMTCDEVIAEASRRNAKGKGESEMVDSLGFRKKFARGGALHQHQRAAGIRRDGAARRHQSFRARPYPERSDPERRRFQSADGEYPQAR